MAFGKAGRAGIVILLTEGIVVRFCKAVFATPLTKRLVAGVDTSWLCHAEVFGSVE